QSDSPEEEHRDDFRQSCATLSEFRIDLDHIEFLEIDFPIPDRDEKKAHPAYNSQLAIFRSRNVNLRIRSEEPKKPETRANRGRLEGGFQRFARLEVIAAVDAQDRAGLHLLLALWTAANLLRQSIVLLVRIRICRGWNKHDTIARRAANFLAGIVI